MKARFLRICTLLVVLTISGGSGKEMSHKTPYAGKKGTAVGQGPLDVNASLGQTLGEVTGVLGIGGDAVASLVMGLTGISVHDCAGNYKDEDLSMMTCQEFLQVLSECDSMQHLKPQIEQIIKKSSRKPNYKRPCFKN